MAEGNGSTTHKEGLSPKTFAKGDLVVYPNHGAGTVSGIEEKTILGEERRYYIVYVPDGGLTLNIPADGESGLRTCADDEEVAEALEISRVAEVVRDLSAHGGDRGLSTGERNLLAKARRILVSEVALGKNLETGEAEALVDGALSGDGKA
jgi:CarD family transcriptional regulator